MKKLLLILLVLVILPAVTAKEGHINLLAVSQQPDGSYIGSSADLYLEIKPGDGRVFIDTLPASKLDTQISTRFARDMACKYLEVDCSGYDFFYTIRAQTSIVGGPSAGAATTALTISLIEDLELDESVVVTGTINSGQLIGPVGGLKPKILAASEMGMRKVLIPQGEDVIEENNLSINLIEYGNELGIEVKEVSNVDEMLYEFTGLILRENNGQLEIDPKYSAVMAMLADYLCNRTEELQQEVVDYPVADIKIVDMDFLQTKKQAYNLTLNADMALENNESYSRASYCFGANVKYRTLLYWMQKLSEEEVSSMINETQEKIDNFTLEIESYPINSITRLQTFMIVKDRLEGAEDWLNKTQIALDERDKKEVAGSLAYAVERLGSAYSWAKFFDTEGEEYVMDNAVLMESCLSKISEAEERYNYVQLFFPHLLGAAREYIEAAKSDYINGDYKTCLYKAIIVKASINTISSAIGVEPEKIDTLIGNKLEAAKKEIIQQQRAFPILGYSYYEYSNSLRKIDPYTALLYAEYALELSNLDIYFEAKEKRKLRIIDLGSEDLGVFLFGFIFGILILCLLYILFVKPRRRKIIRIKRKTKIRL